LENSTQGKANQTEDQSSVAAKLNDKKLQLSSVSEVQEQESQSNEELAHDYLDILSKPHESPSDYQVNSIQEEMNDRHIENEDIQEYIHETTTIVEPQITYVATRKENISSKEQVESHGFTDDDDVSTGSR